jgi:hypothetical protein
LFGLSRDYKCLLDSSSAVPPKVCVQATVVPTPRVETGGWKTVKAEKTIAKDRAPSKVQKQNGFSSLKQVILVVFPPSYSSLSLSEKLPCFLIEIF